jgi:hypothetical protein
MREKKMMREKDRYEKQERGEQRKNKKESKFSFNMTLITKQLICNFCPNFTSQLLNFNQSFYLFSNLKTIPFYISIV